jgi:acyl dehydratase
MGLLAARLEDDNAVTFDLECPVDHGRITPNLAHVSWTAGIMSEMCGSLPLYLGVMAFAGTVTTRFVAPVPVGERLTGRAILDRRERRKLFVDTTLTSLTGTELAAASGIAIEMRGPEE